MTAMRISSIFKEKRIQPGIKVRRNSIISSKNNKVRNREVELQTEDSLKWKKKRGYGKRWMAETAFSSIKRTYGEYVSRNQVSKHGKRDDNEGIFVQSV